MTHDPMCMWSTNATPDPLPDYDCGECDLIMNARKEERIAAGKRVDALLSGDFHGTPGYLALFANYRKHVIAAAMDNSEYVEQEKP